jgi:hypothetical protein
LLTKPKQKLGGRKLKLGFEKEWHLFAFSVLFAPQKKLQISEWQHQKWVGAKSQKI